MRNEQRYRNLLKNNPNANIGFLFAAAAVFAARHGACEAKHHSTNEYKIIARRLKSEYGETLTADEVNAEMDLTVYWYDNLTIDDILKREE